MLLTSIRTTLKLFKSDGYRRWLILGLLAAVASLAEAAGAGLVLALLALAASPENPAAFPVVGDVRSYLPDIPHARLVALLALLTVAFVLIRSGLVILRTYATSRIIENTSARMATRLVSGYLRMPYIFHLNRNSAELIRNTKHSVGAVVGNGVLPLVTIASEGLMAMVLVGFLLIVEPVPTLAAAAIMSVTVAILMLVVQPRMKRLGQIVQDTSMRSLMIMQQSMRGIGEIRVLGREDYFSDQYKDVREEAAVAHYRAATMGVLPRVTIEATLMISILGFLAVTVVRSDDITAIIASLGILAYVGMRLQPSLQSIVSAANNLKYATAAIEELDEEFRLLDLAQALDTSERPSGTVPRLHDRIDVRELGFTYPDGDVPALSGVNLTVESGQSIGICGPTGGGKSTLIAMLTGLIEPDQGSVTVDGVNIHDNVSDWHAQLGVVTQRIFVTDDTLRHNIALGVHDDDIDDEAMREAVNLARLDEWINQLPDGIDTGAKEGGNRLSGGQKQRVAIARALYRRPSVIILDEGTSALDGATETAFMQGIEDLRGRHTLIMVAHRLSTVEKCDRIYLIEDGRISDEGTYEELVSRNDTFRAMTVSRATD